MSTKDVGAPKPDLCGSKRDGSATKLDMPVSTEGRARELGQVRGGVRDVGELGLQAGKDLEVRRAALRESLAKAGRERLDLVQAGGETYQRLSLSLRAKLGPKSETLLRFGVSPKKSRRRKGVNPRRSKGSRP